MKRDMDLVRELMLKLEGEPLDGNLYSLDPAALGIEGRSDNELSYHLIQIIDAGLLDGERDTSGQFLARKITWKGHEFLDDVRSPEVWRKTKDGLAKVGGWGIDLTLQIAKAYGKQIAKEKLGLDLG